jgi:hypothetical protein
MLLKKKAFIDCFYSSLKRSFYGTIRNGSFMAIYRKFCPIFGTKRKFRALNTLTIIDEKMRFSDCCFPFPVL